jgi:hypothetical protein
MLEAASSAKGTMFPRELASSKAAMYSLRRSSSMTVHGYPPEAIIAFIRNLPIRPLPSGQGCVNTNTKCPRTARTQACGSPEFDTKTEEFRFSGLAGQSDQ